VEAGRRITSDDLANIDQWLRWIQAKEDHEKCARLLEAHGLSSPLEGLPGVLGGPGRLSHAAQAPASQSDALEGATESEVPLLMRALCTAFVTGCNLNWKKVFAGLGGQLVDLPTYAFQRQRYGGID
jgi:acyl transferase domain-containing protein